MLGLQSFRGYTPRYRLRAAFTDRLLRRWSASGRFVEIGPGTGEFLKIWNQYGLTGIAHEISDDVLPMLRREADGFEGIAVEEDPALIPPQAFDYLFAFEVLEHIESDLEALRSWSNWLKPGGRVLISVPARVRHWTESDDLVGHYRRYERSELRSLLEGSGFINVSIWTYGFPVTALTRQVRSSFARSVQNPSASQMDRTMHSALASVLPRSPTLNFLIDVAVALGRPLQVLFSRSDRGDGYVATGVKGG